MNVLIGLVLASTATPSVPLRDVIDRAAERPRVQASRQTSERARAAAAAEWRQAYLPTVGGSAFYTRTDRLLSLVTPVGSFPFGAQGSMNVGVTVTQPILDTARLFFTGPAADREAEAARLAAGREAQRSGAEAAEIALDVLSLDAGLAATEAFEKSLAARLEKLAAFVDVGRTIEADRLRVELALADARQDLLALTQRRDVARRALGRAIGADDNVVPTVGSIALTVPAEADAVEQAIASRRDLAALRAQKKAADKRSSGVYAELVPKLEAEGGFVYGDGLPYDTDRYFTGTLRATWVPFAAGTRFARADLHDAESAALEAQYTEAVRGIRVAIRSAFAAKATAEADLDVATKGIRQAEATLAAETVRYEAGRITASELLEAEALLRDRRTRQTVAQLNVLRSKIRIHLELGTL